MRTTLLRSRVRRHSSRGSNTELRRNTLRRAWKSEAIIKNQKTKTEERKGTPKEGNDEDDENLGDTLLIPACLLYLSLANLPLRLGRLDEAHNLGYSLLGDRTQSLQHQR